MIAVIVIVVIVVLIVGFFWLGYNSLVKKRNQVDNAWSQIDVQLKRRHDLIPNLADTVKGYAAPAPPGRRRGRARRRAGAARSRRSRRLGRTRSTRRRRPTRRRPRTS